MKLINIQIGRGVAAVVVVIHHLLLPQMQMIYKNSLIFEIFNFNLLGDFAVYFFFCISGYVMMLSTNLSHKKPISFIRDRVVRIFPLYVIWTVVSLTVYYITRNHFSWLINLNYIPKSWNEYVSVFLLFPPLWHGESFALPLATAWSLVYEMFFYVLFTFALTFTKVNRIPWLLIMFFFLCVLL